MKKIVITGKNSYVGNAMYNYLTTYYDKNYTIDKISIKNININNLNLSNYDVVFHVAGIAHSDFGKINKKKADKYYKINTDMTITLANMAKKQNVKQFIFMSSIIVYGESAPIGVKKNITDKTLPIPNNAYGDSKLKAENGIIKLNDYNFNVAIIRAPMIYGDNAKGNYKTLQKIALRLPLFPYIKNERSVIKVNKLCEYIKNIIDNDDSGIFFPQDDEYMNTSTMVKKIANKYGRHVMLVKGFESLLKLFSAFVPKINKAFGNLTYDKSLKYIKL